MDEWMDIRMGGWMDEWEYERMKDLDGCPNVSMNERLEGWMDIWRNEWMDGCKF